MKIKTKLSLAVGILFLFILLLGTAGVYYVDTLKANTENILLSNYHTLEYSRNMLVALQDSNPEALRSFETNLENQEKNVTEPGEPEATRDLRMRFDSFRVSQEDPRYLPAIRGDIFRIMAMNMNAIRNKSEMAKKTASSAFSWITIIGTVCFLFAFVLVVNLPSSVANPIRELTRSIRQIALQNYSQRVHFESHNEFGELARSFNSMAERLEEYNHSSLSGLMMEKKRIEALINNMVDPVIGLDENLRVIFANQEAIKISGLKEPELVGQLVSELSKRNDLIRMLTHDLMKEEVAGGTSREPLKIFSGNKEGYFEKEILQISIIPTGERAKKLIGHVIILRNVTEYKELDYAKTRFIATVSHEFKTPISSIKMSVQLLEHEQIGSLNSEQKELLKSIEDDADRLLKITGELLNLTQLESGNIQLTLLPCDPKEIVDFAVGATKIQAEQKHVKIEITCPPDLPKLQADSEKTSWVLTNLITNAIRHSYEQSTIFIHVYPKGDKVCLSVRDTGQGIPPQYKDKIFDRYFRVPGTKMEGTGLGLAISKEFIEAEGGEITLESEFGAGSNFVISLNAVP